MTTLFKQIKEEHLKARKGKTPLKGVLGLLVSDIYSRQKEAQLDEPTEEMVVAAVRKQIKMVVDQAEYAHDFEAEYGAELEMLQSFLPNQISDENLQKEIASQREANPDAPMGRIIGTLKKRLGDSVDGQRLANAVREHFKG